MFYESVWLDEVRYHGVAGSSGACTMRRRSMLTRSAGTSSRRYESILALGRVATESHSLYYSTRMLARRKGSIGNILSF